MKTILFNFVLISSVLFLPGLVSAAPPLVPCDGLDCNACHFVEMGNTILVWLIGIMFIVFAVILAAAGWGLVTSAGNQTALSDAKSKFTNAFIGLFIVLGAWLLVDTIMQGLLDSGDGTITGYGPWSEIECVSPEAVGLPPISSETSIPSGSITAANACAPIAPLTDPAALLMENGQTVVWLGTDPQLRTVATKFAASVGGTITSAYRPQSYQSHLYEVSTKACLVSSLPAGTCPHKDAIMAELGKHGLPLCGAVAQAGSQHTSGTGVDITGFNHSVYVKVAKIHCLEWKNYPEDPFHYELIPGCTVTVTEGGEGFTTKVLSDE
jgi:hypothetical protein